MIKQHYLNSLFFLLFLYACSSEIAKTEKFTPKVGSWLMEMDLGKEILPFNFTLNKSDTAWEMVIINAEEKIVVTNILERNDSLFIQLPVFDSEFILKIVSDTSLKGTWNNYYKAPNYKIPSTASFGYKPRFSSINRGVQAKPLSFAGKYKATFSPQATEQKNAIALFSQNSNRLFGTFATETGDYRHLEGNVYGDTLFLSSFDGAHAFLFTGTKVDSTIQGKFYSGTHWEQDWIATINDTFQLRNADSLTFIKDGYDGLTFEFPNSKKERISLEDKRYDNKAIIVQIMGTWCPNCLDETYYLSDLYNRYKAKGLEVIALAFERTKTEEKAYKNIARLREKTGASYEILLGGATREDKAAEKLPMLNHVMSYPTAIFIDKNKKVRRIHTGFYGPSTGGYYNEFTSKTEMLVKKMLSE